MPDRFYYDDLGNRTGTLVSETGLEHEYSSNEVNQYEQIDSEQLYYDDAGNLIGDDRGYQYDYDFENRLVKVHDFGDTLLVEYEYDALGRRIIKRQYDSEEEVDKTVRYYHNDRWQVVNMATDFADAADEDIENEFVYGNGIDEPLVMYSFIDNEPNSLETYYYCCDNLGSVVALVDDSGAVVERYSYDVWGEPTIYNASGTEIGYSDVGNPFMFTAREVDILDNANLKFQHSRHRVLHYKLARWMQNDPLGTVPNDYMNPTNPIGQYKDGLNVYEYALSNSQYYVDILGLCIPYGSPEFGGSKPKPKNYVPIWGCYSYMNHASSLYDQVLAYLNHFKTIAEHKYIYFGNTPFAEELDRDGLDNTFGFDSNNKVRGEVHTKPTRCFQYAKKQFGFLKKGPAATTPCKCATIGEIKSCIAASKPKYKYRAAVPWYLKPFRRNYSCQEWVDQAASDCCLYKGGRTILNTKSPYYDEVYK